MALPLVGAVYGLGTVLSAGFAGVATFLSAYVSKKIAVGAALGITLVAGWVALQAAMIAAWAAIGFVVPEELQLPLQFVVAFLPSNLDDCIATIVLAKIGRWLWDQKREWVIATAQV